MPSCSRCGEEKPETQFSFRDKVKGVRFKECKTCIRDRQRAHYKANPEQYRERNKRWIERRRAFIRKAKEVPCARCGQSFAHFAMDFHHREEETKDGVIGNLINEGVSWARLKAEIAKCDVVCAVCHRYLHHSP